jgi:predicted nucleic acid-binding protein
MGNLKEDLRNYSTIAIDTNLFVYLMEKHPEYLENVSVIFRMIESGNCSGITSVLAVSEILTKPLKDNNKILVSKYKIFINTFPNLIVRNMDYKIALRTAKIRAKYGLKTPDAIFVATAIEEKAGLFITNDIKLRKVSEINILVLDDYKRSTTPS